jgi:hypothetical protein
VSSLLINNLIPYPSVLMRLLPGPICYFRDGGHQSHSRRSCRCTTASASSTATAAASSPPTSL